MKPTFHVLGLAHQPVTKQVPSCAYTMKVVNMCAMLKAAGHRVILYHASSSAIRYLSDECVQVVSDTVMRRLYGERFCTTYNQGWQGSDAAWTNFRREAAGAIAARLQGCGQDIVLASYGNLHQGACPATSLALSIEMGIGYEGVFAQCKVWESFAWCHYVTGLYRLDNWERDTVISGYFDCSDLAFSPAAKRQPYLLYMGRVVAEKGVVEACHAAKLLGRQIKIAGVAKDDFLKVLRETGADIDYLGMVDIHRRKQLMSEASALIAYSKYVEPFGNVVAEASYCGLPVVASDRGGFTETVVNGINGFRCRDIPGMVGALKAIEEGKIDSIQCNKVGSLFSRESIWPQYDQYFNYQHQVFLREHGYKE